MNRLAIFLVAALLFSGSAFASEVAEAAKKERERREALQKTGKPARVFTNQDVANLKSSLAFEASQAEGEETPVEEGTQTEPTPATTPPTVRREDTTQSREEEERKQELERLKGEREELEQQARDAQQTINQGGGYHTRNIGNQYKIKREAESRIREIDQEIEKREAEEEEE